MICVQEGDPSAKPANPIDDEISALEAGRRACAYLIRTDDIALEETKKLIVVLRTENRTYVLLFRAPGEEFEAAHRECFEIVVRTFSVVCEAHDP